MSRPRLRVAGGPNLGATLILPPGRLILGSGEESDLIFSDDSLAPAQVALVVTSPRAEGEPQQSLAAGAPGDGPGESPDDLWTVRAEPLAGESLIDGVSLEPGGAVLGPGQILALGFSAVLWQPEGEPWAPPRLVALEYFSGAVPGKNPEPAAVPAAVPANSDNLSEPVPGPASSAAEAPDPDDPAAADPALAADPDLGPEPRPADRRPDGRAAAGSVLRSHLFRWIGLAAVILLLALLVLGPGDPEPAASSPAQELSELLSREGFANLSVSPVSGGLRVDGRLAGDAEFSRLVELVKNRPLRTYLHLAISSDLAAAVEQSLTSAGFYPAVEVGSDGRVFINVYLRNQEAAERAWKKLASDLPQLTYASRVVDQTELEPVLLEAIRAQGLAGQLSPAFRDGWVEVFGPENFTAAEAVSEIFSRVRQSLRTPVVYVLSRADQPAGESLPLPLALPPRPEADLRVSPEPLTGPPAAPDSPAADPLRPDRPLFGLQITGVTIGPMRFVTTRDGHRLFEGSQLPGGWVILVIEPTSLTLGRGGETAVFPLGEEQLPQPGPPK
ncbi:MAG: type III secretion system inner membrane ring subunit SctD [Deltaproteobacteria bacterium]|jgi:type III secretion protein D|nr:type III secretion system inner membrane ring subunit SctD [Deltaproteobacteria bacterium]